MATERHIDQVDKAGQPYIQHPLRVMQQVQSEQAKIVAVLHDILEDTPTTAIELLELGFSEEIVEAIIALTKRVGETRFQAAQRTAQNALACEVKLADLQDNMNLSRLPKISPKDLLRVQQYQIVHQILQQALKIHQHYAALDLPDDYPPLVYATQTENYQYLLNAMFDQFHPMGGVALGLAQEWWCLFEQASEYFSFCQRKDYEPDLSVYLQLINTTDQEILGEIFQSENDQNILKDIFQQFTTGFFKQV